MLLIDVESHVAAFVRDTRDRATRKIAAESVVHRDKACSAFGICDAGRR